MIRDWSETPFRLASANMRAEYLSLPELRDYLRFNSDFPDELARAVPHASALPDRFALDCAIVVVFIAAPLAIGFSRGGVLSSVAAAIGLVFHEHSSRISFSRSAKATRIPPWVAAWTPKFCSRSIGAAPALGSLDEPRLTSSESIRRPPRDRLMNPLANDWPIKHRADVCAMTNRPFVEGEQFYTLLFREGNGFRREDLSEEAWASRNENIRPFSFWKTRYEPPPATPPEPLPKENAEELLRRFLAENRSRMPATCSRSMLERKRVLKQIKTEQTENGRVLIYEHAKSGDVFIVPDVQLRLDELETLQNEVAQLLQSAAST